MIASPRKMRTTEPVLSPLSEELAGCGSLRSQAKQRGRELFGWQTAGAAQPPGQPCAWLPDSACRCTLPNVTSEGGVGSNRPQSRSFNVQSLGVVSNGGRAWPRQGRPKSRRLLECRVQFFFALAVFTFTRGHPPRPSAAASSSARSAYHSRRGTPRHSQIPAPPKCERTTRNQVGRRRRVNLAFTSLSGSRRPGASSGHVFSASAPDAHFAAVRRARGASVCKHRASAAMSFCSA
jgi:hypothetical protein